MADAPTGNVADLVTEAAASVPRHPALLDEPSGVSLTWGAVEGAGHAFAARLLAAGLEAGDRVAVGEPGDGAVVVAFVGGLRAGGGAAALLIGQPANDVRRTL